MLTFQQLILRLNAFWDRQGCVLLQPYDMEVGAGTFHTATFLRAIGPEPWNAAYVQPSRRPKDGRYGENPNRLQHYYQYQVVLKPSPADIQDLLPRVAATRSASTRRSTTSASSRTTGSRRRSAPGASGWEVWLDGMEVTQFTYFQQVGGLACKPVLGEITYGLERLAMYLQGKESVFDLVWIARASTLPATCTTRTRSSSRATTSSSPTPTMLFAPLRRVRDRGEAPDRGAAASCRRTRWC